MVASNQGLEDDSSLVLARDDKEDRSVVDVFDATGISEQRALCAVLNGPPSSDVGESTSTVEEAIVETRQESALQRAEALAAALKNPTYIAKMGERSVIRSSLYISAQCSKEWMPSAQYKTVTVVDTEGTEWPMFWTKVSADIFGLGSGWSDFASRHNLEVGDACLLELIEVNRRIKIHILRKQKYSGTGSVPALTGQVGALSKKKSQLNRGFKPRHSRLYSRLIGKKDFSIAMLGSTSVIRPYLKAQRSKRSHRVNIPKLSTFLFAPEEAELNDLAERQKLRAVSEILALSPQGQGLLTMSLSHRATAETASRGVIKSFLSTPAAAADVGHDVREDLSLELSLAQPKSLLPAHEEARQNTEHTIKMSGGRHPETCIFGLHSIEESGSFRHEPYTPRKSRVNPERTREAVRNFLHALQKVREDRARKEAWLRKLAQSITR